ncbi:CBS domain-containing protein [Pseudodesulfovibrio piezophilus]|uniref:Polynucleotide adenylyltransferase region n=1 Tax=Pseudodesulfovibrio piezophilus (strain DSM 21447 / JCM 15486 / C1TLV30) TaxID=1322246 RepID=M1WJI2_PSEP2|nr:CBS domain-containing protein [Pseudodesulfovibrio piezophilus]CCH47941.1 Polynucleotide adenylyltransferase region [Pseudodesulfovibrio piezophilus C1TLV30]
MNKEQKASKIRTKTVITSHANADFDALASMVAASKIYPDSTLIFPGSQEKNLRNFFIQSTTYLFNFKAFKDIDPSSVELLVVCDTRQKARIPHVRPLLDNPNLRVHLYDHHPDTDDDLVAEKSIVREWGSTTTIITSLIMEQHGTLTSEEATLLGLGIYEDTGSFGFNTTTPHDFNAAGWLKSQGMDIEVIKDLLSHELSAQQITNLGELLQNANNYDIHGIEILITEISTDKFVPDFALLVHKLMDMEDIKVVFALGRMGDRIHVIARSKNPDVNVGKICSTMGGGGHEVAASATVKDKTLAEVRDDLFALLYSQINPQIIVKGLMSGPPVTIEGNKTVDDSVELMTRYGLKDLPVVEKETMHCIGIMGHAIADKAASHGLGGMPLSEYMSQKFDTVTAGTDLYTVMEIILGNRQRMLPVLEDNNIIGVITRTDLMNMLIEEPARIPDSLMPDRRREKNIASTVTNRLPQKMLDLLNVAGELGNKLGWEIYAVGGFVRDILLGRPNLDLDLVVEGDGIFFAKELVKKLGGRVKAHNKFKTAVVILENGQRVDVATARLEYYEYPAALPTVELSSIKMDLYRRDFTVNALALRLNPDRFGQLVDFFGAERDIRNKTIRVLHSLSFVEDPTRILRAIRFERRFDFQIGGQTMRLVKNALNLKLFSKLSGTRVMHELQLIVSEEDPLACLNRMQELGIMEAIHPLLKLHKERIQVLIELAKVHNWYKLLYLEQSVEPWKLYFLGMTMGIKNTQIKQVTDRFHFTQREEREFLQLREMIHEALIQLMSWREGKSKLSRLYSILHPLPVEGVLFLMGKSRKEHIRRNISQYLARLRDMEIEITGNDLHELGIEPGPIYSTILEKIMAAKIDGQVETKKDELDMAQECYARESAKEDKADES